MATVKVALGERSYSIKIEAGLLEYVGDKLAPVAGQARVAVVAQDRVWDLFGAQMTDTLNSAGLNWFHVIVPNGETAKTLNWVSRLYQAFAKNTMDRKSVVVAFGGGAVGDLAGFAAASWLRGIDFVQVPTTLLAQVDASVGGKTGVNLPAGKNLVGAFWQPKAVLIDPLTLTTLPKRDLKSGLAEVIKYGIILDTEFFNFARERRKKLLDQDPASLTRAIKRSCELKAYVVKNDERESGLRAILNYGHTLGHAVESVSGYGRLRHGEAVSIGMALAGRIAVRLGMFDEGQALEIEQVLRDFGLPLEVPLGLSVSDMLASVTVDKKSVGGKARFVLASRIGQVEISDSVTVELMTEVIKESQARAVGLDR